jgi:hypothetical protein
MIIIKNIDYTIGTKIFILFNKNYLSFSNDMYKSTKIISEKQFIDFIVSENQLLNDLKIFHGIDINFNDSLIHIS